MVVADEDATLLTVCEKGYGKRTKFGPGLGEVVSESVAADDSPETDSPEPEAESSGSSRYRTQRRGGKGLRDIKTTERNGRAIAIVRVDDTDELLMMTAGGKIQRLAAAEIGVIGRNTQGVRIMSLDKGDTVAAIVRVPKEEGTVDGDLAEDGELGEEGVAEEVAEDSVAESGDQPSDEETPDEETPESTDD